MQSKLGAMLDFRQIAKDYPLRVAAGGVIGAATAATGLWAGFDNRPLFRVVWAVLVDAFNARDVVVLASAGVLALSFVALVSVVWGSVQNKREARRLSAENTRLEQQCQSLAVNRATLGSELDSERAAHAQTKRDIAVYALRRLGGMRFGDGRMKPKVTIRFVEYAKDYDLVKHVEKVIHDHTGWEVELDGANKPALQRAGEFKVLFESGLMQAFDELAAAFSQSELLGVPVGRSAEDRNDDHHLIVKVLPSA